MTNPIVAKVYTFIYNITIDLYGNGNASAIEFSNSKAIDHSLNIQVYIAGHRPRLNIIASTNLSSAQAVQARKTMQKTQHEISGRAI